MEESKGKVILKWFFYILVFGLLMYIGREAGWVLNGNKNHVSEQEKKEAIREVEEELHAAELELQEETQEATNELDSARRETREAARRAMKPLHESLEKSRRRIAR